MTSQLAGLATRYSEAWANHDPDAIVAMHTEDTVFHTHGVGEPAQGKPAVRSTIAELFEQSPDIAFELQATHFGDDHFVTRYTMSGTAFGRHVSCDGVDVFTVRDEKIVRKDTYLDLAAYFRQLGPLGFARAGLQEVRGKFAGKGA